MQQFIATYGYLAVFVLMLAESACIPVPSELIMTFAGALAAGAVPGTSLNLIGVILAGTAGNVAGSYIAWAVGRYLGLPALSRLTQGRWGRRLRFRERELDRAVAWFDRYGGKAVLIGRVLPVVRTFISLPAGIAGMAPVRFGIYTTVGCLPWTATLATAGYAVGANWESIVSAFHGPTYIIAAVVLLGIVVFAWRYWRRPSGESVKSAETPGAAGSGPPEAEAGRAEAEPRPAEAEAEPQPTEPQPTGRQPTGPRPAEPRPAEHSPPGAHRRLPQCHKGTRRRMLTSSEHMAYAETFGRHSYPDTPHRPDPPRYLRRPGILGWLRQDWLWAGREGVKATSFGMNVLGVAEGAVGSGAAGRG